MKGKRSLACLLAVLLLAALAVPTVLLRTAPYILRTPGT